MLTKKQKQEQIGNLLGRLKVEIDDGKIRPQAGRDTAITAPTHYRTQHLGPDNFCCVLAASPDNMRPNYCSSCPNGDAEE